MGGAVLGVPGCPGVLSPAQMLSVRCSSAGLWPPCEEQSLLPCPCVQAVSPGMEGSAGFGFLTSEGESTTIYPKAAENLVIV